MKCANCGSYYRLDQFNQTNYCDSCSTHVVEKTDDEDFSLEKDLLVNPSGKTRPVFYDDDCYGL